MGTSHGKGDQLSATGSPVSSLGYCTTCTIGSADQLLAPICLVLPPAWWEHGEDRHSLAENSIGFLPVCWAKINHLVLICPNDKLTTYLYKNSDLKTKPAFGKRQQQMHVVKPLVRDHCHEIPHIWHTISVGFIVVLLNFCPGTL